MLNFGIRFFICNIFIAVMVVIILAAKQLFKKQLSSRMQYSLWFIMLVLLAVPFLPVRPTGFTRILSWFESLKSLSTHDVAATLQAASNFNHLDYTSWINDFSISVSRSTPSIIDFLILFIWLVGILAMILLVTKSCIRLHLLKQSALPLQNTKVKNLYYKCIQEMNLNKNIPVYSTAFLKSPIIVGFFAPRIYLPIHLISDYNPADMRYMMLHELQHYKHKDALVNYLMNLAGILYWFNPFVWYALKQMRNDREIACDTSVLHMLNENDYEAYGNTLINFAEKVSLYPFPFTAGIGGNTKQMKQRILNIASYKPPSLKKRLKSIFAYAMIALFFLGLAPALSIYAAEKEVYQWKYASENVSYSDFSSYFEGYSGSFILYDLENEAWEIYNREHAILRASPDSTYKIYDALLGLETGVITAKQSQISWNKETYPFEAWNADQDLYSAMHNSVNWYFQSIDAQIGPPAVKRFIQKIRYGNQNITGDFSSYWMEASLKISPIEQIELLKKLYNNDFGFSTDNIQAVKDAICLSSSPQGSLYGKTGTGRVNGQDINGWFVGYVESSDHIYFFATNIQAKANASGAAASKITLSILSDLQIWN